jgi:hypothetical protein
MAARKMLFVILTTCLLLQAVGSGMSSAAVPAEVAGSRLGAPFLISQPTAGTQPERYSAAVAYNWVHREYLVVWHNSWMSNPTEIVGERLSANGELIGFLTIASGIGGDGKPRSDPAVAYNATNDEYLVVYEYEVTDETDYDTRGKRVAGDGSWLGSEFEIFNWADRGFFTARVAWNPYRNQYLVVATAVDTVSHKFNDVAARRVMADGSTPYDGHSVSLQSQTLQPQGGDVTYNLAADEYLVVWRQNFLGNDWDIWGARVRGDNDAVVTPPGQFAIDTLNVDENHPAVATNTQDRYLVVWDQGVGMPATDYDIYGRELNISGAATTLNSFPIAVSSDEETFPDVAINGGNQQRMVVWRRDIGTGYAVYQFGWYPDVMAIWMPWEIAPTSPVWFEPKVEVGGAGILTVYNKRDTTSFVWGRLYWANSVYLPQVRK